VVPLDLHMEGGGLNPMLVFKVQQVPVKSETMREFLISSSSYPHGLFSITRQFPASVQHVPPLCRTEPSNGFSG